MLFSTKVISASGNLMLNICDPELVDQRAKRDQATLVEKHGGRDAVLKRGSFNGTPAPGEKAIYG